jgi:hypothetical protein
VVQWREEIGMTDFYGLSGWAAVPEHEPMTESECERKITLLRVVACAEIGGALHALPRKPEITANLRDRWLAPAAVDWIAALVSARSSSSSRQTAGRRPRRPHNMRNVVLRAWRGASSRLDMEDIVK